MMTYDEAMKEIKLAKIEGRNADLKNADLKSADLKNADLKSADLEGADLRYADLRYADLRYADLRYADFRSADLRCADFRSADLRNADLKNADLRSADLRNANLEGADIKNAYLRNANLFMGGQHASATSTLDQGSGQMSAETDRLAQIKALHERTTEGDVPWLLKQVRDLQQECHEWSAVARTDSQHATRRAAEVEALTAERDRLSAAKVERVEELEATVALVREYAKMRETYGKRGRTVHSSRIASDLFGIVGDDRAAVAGDGEVMAF